jgi:hypothetical protein
MLKLSHSSKELYLKSPRAWFYNYNLNLREAQMGSPLFFGTLIETGLDVLFKKGTLEQALETFRKNFRYYTINGNRVDLSISSQVRYSKSDLDIDVFSDSELKALEGKSVQFQSWAALQKKGEMLITAYHQEILPKIKKVLDTQVYFSIPNEIGDEIIGYADLICEWEDGRLIIPDHKTSSISAKEVAKNEGYLKQTALYFEAFKGKYPLDSTGFIVLEKKMRKKEPRARVDFIFEKPTEEFVDQTLNEFDDVLHSIKMAEFPCLSPKCDVYGSECCYKKFCQSGGTDMTGLVKVGKAK